jgi:hypothetical protein
MLQSVKRIVHVSRSDNGQTWIHYALCIDAHFASAAKICFLFLFALVTSAALAARQPGGDSGKAATPDATFRFEGVQAACKDQVWPYYSKDCLMKINPDLRSIAGVRVILLAKDLPSGGIRQALVEQRTPERQ